MASVGLSALVSTLSLNVTLSVRVALFRLTCVRLRLLLRDTRTGNPRWLSMVRHFFFLSRFGDRVADPEPRSAVSVCYSQSTTDVKRYVSRQNATIMWINKLVLILSVLRTEKFTPV